MTDKLDEAAFSAWLDRYKAAWERRDPDSASALFAEEATYRETPYDPPFIGRDAIREYWAKAVGGQRDVAFTYEVLACAENRGLCHWHAAFAAAEGGARIDLDGIFHCRFDESGLVATFEEWWHLKVTEAAAG